jgi:hypothetical protein
VPPAFAATSTPVPGLTTPTPAPSRARTASPTPRATASASPTPAATSTPPPAGGAGPADSTPTATPTNEARSSIVSSFPSLNQLSTSPETIGTNVVLSLSALFLILLACAIFNETLEENGPALERMLIAASGPFRGWFGESGPAPAEDGLGAAAGSSHRLLKTVLLLGLTGGIYSAIDPDFGLNTATLALALSLSISLGLLTLLFEGGKILVSSRMFHGSGSLRLHPLGIAVAVGSVFISRLSNMHPGIVLGFVAGAVVSGPNPRQDGAITYVPMIALFLFSLLALGLVEPLRAVSNGSSEWYAVIPETVAVTVFVAGIEGLLFNLLPLTFMEGRSVWDWNRVAWTLLTAPVAFVFFHVVINRTHSYDSALEETTTIALFAACAAFVAVAALFWLMCRFWLPKRTPTAAGHA